MADNFVLNEEEAAAAAGRGAVDLPERGGVREWCGCGKCVQAPRPADRICCSDILAVADIVQKEGKQCVTETNQFKTGCLEEVCRSAYSPQRSPGHDEACHNVFSVRKQVRGVPRTVQVLHVE